MDAKRLENIRLLLLGDSTETSADAVIQVLDSMAQSRLLLMINRFQRRYEKEVTETVPGALMWVVDEVIIQRYNRIGSEGYASQNVEGHSISFSAADFSEFEPDIKSFIGDQTSIKSGRVVVF